MTDNAANSELLAEEQVLILREQAQQLHEANAIAKRRALIDADKLSRNDHMRIQALNAGLAITAREQGRIAETVIADAETILAWLKAEDVRH